MVAAPRHALLTFIEKECHFIKEKCFIQSESSVTESSLDQIATCSMLVGAHLFKETTFYLHSQKEQPTVTVQILFRFAKENSLWTFPSNTVVSSVGSNVWFRFFPVGYGSPNNTPCTAVIRNPPSQLTDALTTSLHDSLQSIATFVTKINQLTSVAYREACFPCGVPHELASETLVKQLRSCDGSLMSVGGGGGKISKKGGKQGTRRGSKKKFDPNDSSLDYDTPKNTTVKKSDIVHISSRIETKDSSLSSSVEKDKTTCNNQDVIPHCVAPIKKRKYNMLPSSSSLNASASNINT